MNGAGQQMQEPAASGAQSQEHRSLSQRQQGQSDMRSSGGQPFGGMEHAAGQLVGDGLLPQTTSQAGNEVSARPLPPPSTNSTASVEHPSVTAERHVLRNLPEGSASFQDLPSRSDMTQEPMVVVVGDRRVRLSSEIDPSSLYSLCRKWVRNRPGEDEELGCAPLIPSVLPKPLPAEPLRTETKAEGAHDQKGDTIENFITGSWSPRELLKVHVRGFRDVRKRRGTGTLFTIFDALANAVSFLATARSGSHRVLVLAQLTDCGVRAARHREQWQQRVKRYKSRLCLIFPPGAAAVAELKDVNRSGVKH